MTKRGDNIPSINEYSHWNEDAEMMWYQENKYDMMYADEDIDDGFLEMSDYDDWKYDE